MFRFYPRLNDYIDENTKVLRCSEGSHAGYIVPEIVMKHGKMNFKSMATIFPMAIKTRREMFVSYKSVKENKYTSKDYISTSELTELKEYIYSLGIDDIGFTNVLPSMIFKDRFILFKNAIVITMEMKRKQIDLAPSVATQKEIFRTYYELGVAVNKISSYLRSMGFNAQAAPALGGDVNYPLLAEKAGLGAIGKHGLLITPKFGPSLRIAAIYTDIKNLPMAKANEHLWVKDFCKSCNKCYRKCPAQAIHKDVIVFNDNSEEHIDYKKCVIPFSKNNGCTICVKECSFYQKNYYAIKEQFHGSN